MAIDRLVGSDAELQKATLGTVLTSGAAVDATWYKIVTISGTTVFPAGYRVGDLIQGGGVLGDFTVANSAAPVTFSTILDASSFSFEMNADEIEVTVLADDVKKYRKGKVDMSGTVEGITFISEARKPGSILNRFLRTVDGGTLGTTPPVLSEVDGSDFYIRGLIQKDDAVGETFSFIFGQVELYGYSLGANSGDAQNWSSGIRFIGADPIVYFMDVEAAT